MSINVLGPDRKMCDVCELDGPRYGIDMETVAGERLFICIVCLQQMVEDANTPQDDEPTDDADLHLYVPSGSTRRSAAWANLQTDTEALDGDQVV